MTGAGASPSGYRSHYSSPPEPGSTLAHRSTRTSESMVKVACRSVSCGNRVEIRCDRPGRQVRRPTTTCGIAIRTNTTSQYWTPLESGSRQSRLSLALRLYAPGYRGSLALHPPSCMHRRAKKLAQTAKSTLASGRAAVLRWTLEMTRSSIWVGAQCVHLMSSADIALVNDRQGQRQRRRQQR